MIDSSVPVEKPPATYSLAFRRRALLLLLVVYIFNFLDRQILNILSEQIKHDLALADWQLGLMSGLTFALFYSLLGIPVARLAERKDRPKIIAASISIWSLATALSGLGQNFIHLLIARFFVGVGEAGGTPPAHSLITEYTPREERSSAFAFYSLGIPLGSLLGLALGGIIADAYGWRATFVLLGLPGVLISLLVLLILREPRRTVPVPVSEDSSDNLFPAIRLLARNRTYRLMALGATSQSIVIYSVATFVAPFFFRVHAEKIEIIGASWGLQSAGMLGIALGISTGLAAAFGTWSGGFVTNRAARKDIRAMSTVPAITALFSIPFYWMAFTASDFMTALFFLAPASFFMACWYGPVNACAQSVVGPNLRATASAVILLLTSLVGLGMGPLLVGVLSDVMSTYYDMGDGGGLRIALIAMVTFALLSFILFLAARRTIEEDLV